MMNLKEVDCGCWKVKEAVYSGIDYELWMCVEMC